MIIIAFKNGLFSLPKQYPPAMDDWEEDEMDSLHIIPEEPGTLLS